MSLAFDYVLDYQTYCLHICSLGYNGKTAARTAKLVKQMETVIKRYKSEDSDPVTILSVLGQFKQACDSNGVPEGVATWLLPFSMAKSPAASITICLTPTNNYDAPLLVPRKIDGQERIYTSIETVSYLPISYAIDVVIAKAALEIELFRKYSAQTAVQLPEALKDKGLRRGDVSHKQHTKSNFLFERITMNVQEKMRVY